MKKSNLKTSKSHSFSSVKAASLPINLPTAQVNEYAARSHLSRCGWPVGLQDTFIANLSKIAIRFFVCDDSDSMNTRDGHRLVKAGTVEASFADCSRWEELTAALTFHATIADAAKAPTQFHFLHGSSPIMVGANSSKDAENLNALLAEFRKRPTSRTPLCACIREVIQQIEGMADELRRNGQKACVIIASDGESTDGDVSLALKPLERLPAWVVIRLCTDEDRIVNYWNNIDNDLEFDIDVLDDLEGEAKEIAEVNPWLTYGEPLHRLREFGIPIKEIDLLDSHALNQDQMRLFCSLLFGGRVENYPHPAEDWRGFVSVTREKNRGVGKVFHPIKKRNVDWVNPSKIPSHYRGGGCVIL